MLGKRGCGRDRCPALGPAPTQRAKPFSAGYVAGDLSRTYDRDVESCLGEARGRMDGEIESTIRSDIGGDRQDINRKDTNFQSLTFKHLLLPIWLLTVIYAGKPFQVFINGITGEVQGQRPWSQVTLSVAIALAVILLIIIAVVWSGSGSGRSQ